MGCVLNDALKRWRASPADGPHSACRSSPFASSENGPAVFVRALRQRVVGEYERAPLVEEAQVPPETEHLLRRVGVGHQLDHVGEVRVGPNARDRRVQVARTQQVPAPRRVVGRRHAHVRRERLVDANAGTVCVGEQQVLGPQVAVGRRRVPMRPGLGVRRVERRSARAVGSRPPAASACRCPPRSSRRSSRSCARIVRLPLLRRRPGEAEARREVQRVAHEGLVPVAHAAPRGAGCARCASRPAGSPPPGRCEYVTSGSPIRCVKIDGVPAS